MKKQRVLALDKKTTIYSLVSTTLAYQVTKKKKNGGTAKKKLCDLC